MLKLVDLTEETAPKIRDLMYKVFGYSHSGKHLYQPEELMARYQRGDFVPMMVADREDDSLLGYFDMGFPFGGRDVAWFGCLALDPDLNEMTRMAVLNTLLKDCIDKVGKSFRYDGLRLVITTDTVDHTLSQRLSGQFGLINVGLLFATVPTGGHQFRGGYRPQGAAAEIRAGRRPEVLSVYPAYKFLEPYDCYLSPDHAEMTLPLYEALDLPVTFREAPVEPADKATVILEYPDLGRGIVTLEIERIGEDIETVLKERVDHFRTGYIPAIHVLVPQFPQDPAVVHRVLAGLGGLFGGLFPRFKGKDMILVQLVDRENRQVDESRLKDEAARKVAQLGRED